MSGYILARLEIGDPALWAEYRRQVVPLLAEFGGETIVNTADVRVFEGAPAAGQLVIVRFPSTEQAEAFLRGDRYQPLRALRERAALSEVVVVPGAGGEPGELKV